MVSRAELYEFHARECVRAAEQTDDPQLRERYLRLAREWRLDIANLPLSECGGGRPLPRLGECGRFCKLGWARQPGEGSR